MDELDLLPWQEAAWTGLRERLRDDRLPHALLVAGPPGVGKGRLARRLAAAQLCESPRDGEPCGACPACHWVARDEHPDLHRCEPEAGKAAIRVDAVRELIDFLALSAHRGAVKLAHIEPAEAMNVNAANSLLKTLEEPPPGARLILVSHRPGRLPATIRSRCQRLDLPLPPRREAVLWLEKQGVAEEAAALLELAGGAPLQALAWGDEVVRERQRETWQDLLALAEGRGEVMAVAERWSAGEPVQRLLWWRRWLLQLRRLQAGVQVLEPEGLARLAPLPPEAVHAFDRRLERLQVHLEGPVNIALQLADIFNRWVRFTRPLRQARG